MGGSHALPLLLSCRPNRKKSTWHLPSRHSFPARISQPMRDCHDSPMKTYLTLSSQLAAMDFLFITVIPKSYLSLYKKKKKAVPPFCSLDLPMISLQLSQMTILCSSRINPFLLVTEPRLILKVNNRVLQHNVTAKRLSAFTADAVECRGLTANLLRTVGFCQDYWL